MIISQANAKSLERELAWFDAVLNLRFTHYFGSPETQQNTPDVGTLVAPDLSGDESPYAQIVREFAMGFDERLVFILCLIPHMRPQALDIFFTQSQITGRTYTEFGGWRGKAHSGFLPTAETAVFILAGQELHRRFDVLQLFDEQHYFLKQRLIKLEHQASGEPFLNATISVTAEFLHRCTHGHVHKPDYSIEFPAKLITSKLNWDDLVLSMDVRDENTSAKPKKISLGCLTRRKIKTGFCFLMKLMHFLANAPRPAVPTIATPTRKFPTCCSAWRIFPVWSFSPATSKPISMRPLPAASNPLFIFHCQMKLNVCTCGKIYCPILRCWPPMSTCGSWRKNMNFRVAQ
ncbi:MAG: family ATPase [Cellvibrio sp.]|nr:family ATPase [Cellvibrio sp.]